jgi:hypothetical protein
LWGVFLGEGEPHRLQNDDLRRRVRLADAHGQLVGGGLVARVVDRDIRAGGGEFEGDDGAEAAVFVTQESIGPVFCSWRWGEGWGTDREPAVTRTARLVRENGIVDGGVVGVFWWWCL